MAVPYTFGSATSAIPLSQLDSNFATTITLGNTAIQLGNTVTTLNNMTFANVTIASVAAAITPAQGGTGLTTLTANNVIIGAGTSNVTFVAPGTTGNVLTSNGTNWLSQAPATSGTVTSVSWTGGIVSVATATTTPAFTIAGTSGGVPYFSNGTTWASSGALAANALVVGGGAGAAPSTVTTGTGVVTALGVNTGSSGAFVVNGGALGTPSSGTLSSCTVDGTNNVGYRNIPQSGSDKTTSYSLATTDVGKFVGVGTSGSITVPNSTFAAGDIVTIFNNTTGNVTLTMSITTAYIAGTNTDKDTLTLATRGIATILFISGTVCVVSGNVS